MKKILVIGSSNIDNTLSVDSFPNPGETIVANDFNISLGGKGLNQAVAASKMGGDVTFLTCLGNDNYKDYIIGKLNKYNIKIKPIIKNSSTGSAYIFVNKDAENEIVVHGGANVLLSKKDILENIDLIKETDYVLIQLEMPIDTVEYIIKISKELKKTVILNPAPYKNIDINVLKNLDYITPNEHELKSILNNQSSYLDNAIALVNLGIKNVIVTLGNKGSLLVNKEKTIKIDSFKVSAIDTTGAGDCYNGAFVSFISQGYQIEKALNLASKASAISVTRKGAAISYPNLSDLK